MIWRVGQYSDFLYHGGLVVLAVATAAVLAAAACPASLIGAAMGWRPLRWIGVRSYGIYLWHYPVIVLTTPANASEDLPRAVWQIAASIGLAALSWRFIEEPVRHGAIGRALKRIRAGQVAGVGASRLAAATGATGVLVVACAGLAGAVAVPVASSAAALESRVGSAVEIDQFRRSRQCQASEQHYLARPGVGRAAAAERAAAHVLHLRRAHRRLHLRGHGLA